MATAGGPSSLRFGYALAVDQLVTCSVLTTCPIGGDPFRRTRRARNRSPGWTSRPRSSTRRRYPSLLHKRPAAVVVEVLSRRKGHGGETAGHDVVVDDVAAI